MSNDHLAVFLYRWDDANDIRPASTVGYGEQRAMRSHFPSTVIGVATRPKGTTIDHMDSTPEYEGNLWDRWSEHVEDVADDVRWFVTNPLECDPDA
jgi:hypothetical protein